MKRSFIRHFTMLLLVSGIVASGVSCKKDDDNNSNNNSAPAKTNTEKLMAHAWKIQSWTIDPPYDNGDGTTTTDMWAEFEDCYKDNTLTFQASNKLMYDEGAVKCDPNDDQVSYGIWLLSPDEKQLIMEDETYNVKSIGENTVVLTSSFEEDGTDYTNTITLVKN